jgi:hypothetical protein
MEKINALPHSMALAQLTDITIGSFILALEAIDLGLIVEGIPRLFRDYFQGLLQ